MKDLSSLLERGAGVADAAFTTADVRRRVRQRKRWRRRIGAAGVLVTLGLGSAGILTLVHSDNGEQVVVEAENPPPTSRPATPADVLGSEWVATSISPAPEQQLAVLPTLTFADGHLTARGVCNFFDTSWSAPAGTVELDPPATKTHVSCALAPGPGEGFVFSVLRNIPSVMVTGRGELALSADGRRVKLERLSDLGSTPTADQLVGRWTNEDAALLVDAAGMELGRCDLGPWSIEAGRIRAPALPPLTCRRDPDLLTELVHIQIFSTAGVIISRDGDSLYLVDERSIAVVLHRSD